MLLCRNAIQGARPAKLSSAAWVQQGEGGPLQKGGLCCIRKASLGSSCCQVNSQFPFLVRHREGLLEWLWQRHQDDSVWDRTWCSRVHRYAVSSTRGLEMIFCFLLIRLTNFALGITRQNPRAHILLSQDDWALELYQQAKIEEGRAFSFYPVHMLLKAEKQLATKSCMMNIFLQIFSLSCFDGGIPVQLGETHKTKAVHFHMERSRNHLSATSFPASAVHHEALPQEANS